MMPMLIRRGFPVVLLSWGLAAVAARGQITADTDQRSKIHRLEGTHLTLYTDLPIDDQIRSLTSAFDQAVPQWCEYFQIDLNRTKGWRTQGHLIRAKQRFIQAGLLPADLPDFAHGYQRAGRVWLYEQPSAYYRRHLLLHEGTHAFMHRFLRGAGPPWYMEGTAELLGTHHWQDGKLRLNYFPQTKRQVPYWGRIKIIVDDRQADRRMSLREIMQYDSTAHQKVSAYAWCWAACAFLDAHPASREVFRDLPAAVRLPGHEFSSGFLRALRPNWNELQESWWVFVDELDYGYDVPRGAVTFRSAKPLASAASASVRTDRNWQSSGYTLAAGTSYHITATGRYKIAQYEQDWWCEPGGVTVKYYRGHPLGMLLGAIGHAPSDPGVGLMKPIAIGLDQTIVPEQTGTLFFRINESPGEMSDNEGNLEVEIRVAR